VRINPCVSDEVGMVKREGPVSRANGWGGGWGGRENKNIQLIRGKRTIKFPALVNTHRGTRTTKALPGGEKWKIDRRLVPLGH